MTLATLHPTLDVKLRDSIAEAYRADETAVVDALVAKAMLPADARQRIQQEATRFVEGVRHARTRFGALDKFLQEYGLSTKEGVALMCLAEALLRIPDSETANSLIRDKIGTADWDQYLGKGDSLFVNASTWALMLTGKVVRLDGDDVKQPSSFLSRLIARGGEPVIRQAMLQAMRILGRQFVMGRTIEEALDRAREWERQGYRYSYDMLGEAARTAHDAERYFETYSKAIAAIGRTRGTRDVITGPGISIKLSALHPRYEVAQRDRVMTELVAKLRTLTLQARDAGIGVCVDAEEADRLDLSLDVIEAVYADPALSGWEGFGLAVQAYQKRASFVIDWLENMARRHGRRLMVRLVKGAYWDTEIKRAQERGLDAYPVFTRKISTDVSYLACARKLLDAREVFYPQFATHNAHTVAAVLEMSGDRQGFEFQRLHGMGEPLYHQIVGPDAMNVPCRVYAPVGSHEDLLAYLVRRLLENGANSSFVNRIQNDQVPIADIIADPVMIATRLETKPHPRIPLPVDLFPDRRNSAGLDLSDETVLRPLFGDMAKTWERSWSAAPTVGQDTVAGIGRPVRDPADERRIVGTVVEAGVEQVEQALAAASRAFPDWSATPARDRAACLDRAADLFEAHRAEFMALAVREAGKTISDALAEVREAVDFCRYYAAHAREHFAEPMVLPGPTGEHNQMMLHGRGVFACISPWNFPMAIFVGQVTAALVAGNCVIAKPAEQTPLIAMRATRILHEAGIPRDVLHLLPGDGAVVGGRLVSDARIAGVAFTGSTETARLINQSLAARQGPIVPFIAETGGQNAMIVDSTALPEQVVDDVVLSAFRSAGQRCSALRVLFVQDGIAPKLLEMLKGAASELRVGDPAKLTTDVGPVIDAEARATLNAHIQRMEREGRLLVRVPLSDECAHGSFVAPHAFEIDRLDRLEREVFGPVLHVIRFERNRLDQVIEAINSAGYGLTLGIHTRIDRTARYIHERLRVGNAYVNRNMIGAVVGVQPFGGEGLSGTGPKAGGPHYLYRFATERTLSVNTTAAGGNTSLVSLGDDVD